MREIAKGSFFVVKGLGVLLVGLPSLVMAASLFCWLVSMAIGPVIVISAIVWSLWKLPAAIRYRRKRGEWEFQAISRRLTLERINNPSDGEIANQIRLNREIAVLDACLRACDADTKQ